MPLTASDRIDHVEAEGSYFCGGLLRGLPSTVSSSGRAGRVLQIGDIGIERTTVALPGVGDDRIGSIQARTSRLEDRIAKLEDLDRP